MTTDNQIKEAFNTIWQAIFSADTKHHSNYLYENIQKMRDVIYDKYNYYKREDLVKKSLHQK